MLCTLIEAIHSLLSAHAISVAALPGRDSHTWLQKGQRVTQATKPSPVWVLGIQQVIAEIPESVWLKSLTETVRMILVLDSPEEGQDNQARPTGIQVDMVGQLRSSLCTDGNLESTLTNLHCPPSGWLKLRPFSPSAQISVSVTAFLQCC